MPLISRDSARRRWRPWRRWTACFAASLISPLALGNGGAVPAGCRIARYQPLELPLLPAAVNDAGEVAGTTLGHRAALWSAAQGLRELPLPPGFEHSDAVAVNRGGQVLGMAHDRSFSQHRPFVFAGGVLTLLPGDQARAFHINDAGEVAGDAVLPGAVRSVPVLWRRDGMHPIDSCCGGSAKRITAGGDAVGDAYDADGRYYAFLWSAALGLRRIDPADRFSSAVAVNERGHIVIEIPARVLLYADGALTRLELAPKYPSHPHAINECDLVVGSFGPFADAARAFAWQRAAGFMDLNLRLPAGSDWRLATATGVNERGQIVGRGDRGRREGVGFLLVPDG